MKRLINSALLALAVSAPLSVFAEDAAKDPVAKGDAAAGQAKAATCIACHGPTGNSTDPQYPKLAGQAAPYLVAQVKAFQKGQRRNPVMMGMVGNLSEKDATDIAAFFSSQKMSPGLASKDAVAKAQKLYRAGDAARGVPACGACHGPGGAGNPAAAYPRLGGQHATYAVSALNRLRASAAEPLPDGNTKTMATVAAKLSDAEIAALASYINGLH